MAICFIPWSLQIRRSGGMTSFFFLEEHAIETRYLLPLINQPVYRDLFGNLETKYPIAASLNRNAFYIGCHPEMSDDDVEYVIERFHQYLRGGRT